MILVTGATGLSGSYVVRELQQRGLAVRALVREASVPAAQALNADLAIGDLADPDSLRRACDGVTGIVHTACTFTEFNRRHRRHAGVAGWVAWCIERKVQSPKTGPFSPSNIPFVYFSSLDVYGLSTASLIVEDTPLDETYNDYARGKVVSERLLTEAAERPGPQRLLHPTRPAHLGAAPHGTQAAGRSRAERHRAPPRRRRGRMVALPRRLDRRPRPGLDRRRVPGASHRRPGQRTGRAFCVA